jgi:hypothetical protein
VSALIHTTPGMRGAGADRAAARSGVGPALSSLCQATSLPGLFRQATRALCDEMGFGRAALSGLRDHALAVHNRSQAVSRYFRMRASSVEQDLAASAGGFG